MSENYYHIKKSWSLFENLRDARRVMEPLFYLVQCFAEEEEIDDALEFFYACKRGEMFRIPENRLDVVWINVMTKAYQETQRIMEQIP